MSLTHWRRSKLFRIISFLILLNFLTSQTLYAQDQFQVQEGTHLYTPVEDVNAEQLDNVRHPDTEYADGSPIKTQRSSAASQTFGDDKGKPQNDDQFLNSSPLSPATPEDKSPFVILNEVKDLRVNSAKNLDPFPPNSVGRIRPSAEATPQDDTVLPEDSSPLPPSSFSHTPLIWDALQSRYNKDSKDEVKKKRSDALAFIKWKRNNRKAQAVLGV